MFYEYMMSMLGSSLSRKRKYITYMLSLSPRLIKEKRHDGTNTPLVGRGRIRHMDNEGIHIY